MELDEANRRSDIYRFLEIEPVNAASFSGVLDEVVQAKVAGVIVRGLYGSDAMRLVNTRIDEGEMDEVLNANPAAIERKVYRDYIHWYGVNLAYAETMRYFEQASRFQRCCARLFRDLDDYEERIRHIVSTLTRGAKAELPRSADGSVYTPSTIRVFPPGAEVPVHCGNRMLHALKDFEYLRALSNGTDQLSFFVVLNKPDSGGELVVYEFEWDKAHATNDAVKIDDAMVRNSKWQPVQLKAGDMVIFNGGRIYHSITKVVGSRPRRTVGGFLSFGKDGERVYYYS